MTMPDARYALGAFLRAHRDGDHDRNLLRFFFLSPAARRLIEDLAERSDIFRQLWRE